MELYTLDSSLRREYVVDRYESLIWTERFADIGDIELVVHATDDNRRLFQEGRKLALNTSYRVMTVESVEDADDSEGRSLLNVKGPSLEDVLNHRANRTAFGTGPTSATWTIQSTPGDIARQVFNAICRNNTAFPADNIPFITDGNLFIPDSIPEPTEVITKDLDKMSVYEVIKELCDSYALGFRLYRGLDDSKVYFNIYSGTNRTTQQDDYTPVIFSPGLDTLSEVSVLTSITNYKNVAYVFAPNGSAVVTAIGSENVSGFDRRVLLVDADDITLSAGEALQNALLQRGREELAKAQGTRAIDGKVPETSRFKYNIDYNLGDLVEMRNAKGETSVMRVTEQIFASDAEGERSYPTLAAEGFITAGSWFSLDSNLVWDNAIGTWDDMP